jgi:parallel beta-helix repeat protein
MIRHRRTIPALALLATLLITGSAPIVQAREIHVSLKGNDAEPGTKNRPLASIQKAADAAQPGDVVMIHPGIYRQPIKLNKGGEPGKPITFLGVAANVVLKGSAVVDQWKPHAPGVWKVENWSTNSQQVFVDGRPLQQIGAQTRWHTEKLWANHVCLPPVGKDLNDLKPSSFYYDKDTKTLYIKPAAGVDPNEREVEVSVHDYVLASGEQSHIVLRNLSFMHSNNTGSNVREGMVRVGGKGWLIEDCQVTYGDFGGISVSGNDHTIRRCYISHNGSVGIDMNGSDAAHEYRWYNTREPMNILVEDCELTGNNYRNFYEQWHAGAFKCVPCCRGVTIRRCNVHNNLGAGIWFDGGLGSNRIEDNIVADNITGIFYEISGPAEGDEFGAIIRNNRVARSSKQGIYISASRKTIVENNTCYQNTWDIVVHGMPRNVLGGFQQLAGNVIRNNIVNGKRVDIVLFTGKDSADNVVDGNFYVNHNGSATLARAGFSASDKGYEAALTKDVAKIRATGFEQNGLAGDPMWVDADKLDFRLKSGSSAAGKGWQPPK